MTPEGERFVQPSSSVTVGDTVRGPCGHVQVCVADNRLLDDRHRTWRHKSRWFGAWCAFWRPLG